MAASTTTASVVTPLPLHVVTSYTPSTGSHQSPHNQIIIQQVIFNKKILLLYSNHELMAVFEDEVELENKLQ